jgi:hypothetical protein
VAHPVLDETQVRARVQEGAWRSSA